MKIMILNGSPHRKGTTAAMVGAFAEGAREAGHDIARFDVAFMDIAGCRACEHCHSHGGACAIRDDMEQIYALFDEVDMIVFASPVYYGSFSAQLHAAINRTYARGIPAKATKTALLLSSGSPGVYAAAERIYRGFLQGWYGTEDRGIVEAPGREAYSGEVRERLFQLGRSA